jgi:hypothetical protein
MNAIDSANCDTMIAFKSLDLRLMGASQGFQGVRTLAISGILHLVLISIIGIRSAAMGVSDFTETQSLLTHSNKLYISLSGRSAWLDVIMQRP